MKKISLLFALAGILLFAGTGCLKDEGFEANEYGISVAEIKAVAFPQAPKSPVVVGITGQSAPLVVDGPFLTIEGEGTAAADVTAKLEFSDAVVTAKGLTPLPAGTYTLSTMDAVIKAGEKSTTALKLTITKSDVLDPSISYGVGILIKAVDGGYKIAANLSQVIIGFTIKNRYDGVYQLTGYHNRVPYTFPYDTEIHLVTTGPNSVIFYWPEVKSNGHPIGVGVGSTSWYGDGISPVIVFDKATNLVSDVYNNPPNATPIKMFTGAGSRISKYDPATKAIVVDWHYNNNPLRAFFDNLKYIGPRK
jgi:Domain of unknown function (DUF1735)